MLNISILDEYPLIRYALKLVVKQAFKNVNFIDFETILETENYIKNHNLEVTIFDLHMKKYSGFELIKYLKENNFNTKCIVFTSSCDYRDYKKAMELGVNGYILKDSTPEDFVYALKTVLRNKTYVDSFFHEYRDQKDHIYDMLTKREYQVFELIGKGFNNTEISKRLYISVNTVKKHVSQVFSKLEVNDRTLVAILANNYFGGRVS